MAYTRYGVASPLTIAYKIKRMTPVALVNVSALYYFFRGSLSKDFSSVRDLNLEKIFATVPF